MIQAETRRWPRVQPNEQPASAKSTLAEIWTGAEDPQQLGRIEMILRLERRLREEHRAEAAAPRRSGRRR